MSGQISTINSPINVDRLDYMQKMQRRKSSLIPINHDHVGHEDKYSRFLRQLGQDAGIGQGKVYEDLSAYAGDELTETAFRLPEEQVIDKNAYQKAQKKILVRKRKLLCREREAKYLERLKKLDRLREAPSKAGGLYAVNATTSSQKMSRHRGFGRARSVEEEGRLELNVIKSIIHDKFGDLDAVKKGTCTDLEEKLEDIRQEELEKWCKKHGKVTAIKLLNREKRVLRRWFNELDKSGSGQVAAAELEDVMLSAGLFKTREQVLRVLSNMDKNVDDSEDGTNFEEFLEALFSSGDHYEKPMPFHSSSKYPNHDRATAEKNRKKLKRIQAMCDNPLGFSLSTLLSEERRMKFLRSIFYNTVDTNMTIHEEKRRILHDKYISALEAVVLEKQATSRALQKAKHLASYDKGTEANEFEYSEGDLNVSSHRYLDLETKCERVHCDNRFQSNSLPGILSHDRAEQKADQLKYTPPRSLSARNHPIVDLNTQNKYYIYAPISAKSSNDMIRKAKESSMHKSATISLVPNI